MLADFSGPLEQSDDDIVIAQCLASFQYASPVTEAMSMKTARRFCDITGKVYTI